MHGHYFSLSIHITTSLTQFPVKASTAVLTATPVCCGVGSTRLIVLHVMLWLLRIIKEDAGNAVLWHADMRHV